MKYKDADEHGFGRPYVLKENDRYKMLYSIRTYSRGYYIGYAESDDGVQWERMGIDTNEVVDGMNTKWNALGFRPGLVGGHCIGVAPYYFTYEAEKLGCHSQIILNSRIVNDSDIKIPVLVFVH